MKKLALLSLFLAGSTQTMFWPWHVTTEEERNRPDNTASYSFTGNDGKTSTWTIDKDTQETTFKSTYDINDDRNYRVEQGIERTLNEARSLPDYEAPVREPAPEPTPTGNVSIVDYQPINLPSEMESTTITPENNNSGNTNDTVSVDTSSIIAPESNNNDKK